MKIFTPLLILVFVTLLYPMEGNSQLASLPVKSKKKSMSVSVDQKVTLIFPESVTEAVIGNTKVNLTKNANKCFLNAADTKGFSSTSLFVSLASGAYYDFILKYRPSVDTTVYLFTEDDSDGSDRYALKASEIEANRIAAAKPLDIPFKQAEEFINNSNIVLEKPVFINDKGVIGQNLVFFLQSIYQENNKTYVRISAKNFSNVAYAIRDIKFHTIPTKGFINTLTGEHHEIKPVFVLNGHKNSVEPKATISKVFVFENLQLNDKKEFTIEILEGNTYLKQLKFALSKQDLDKAIALNK